MSATNEKSAKAQVLVNSPEQQVWATVHYTFYFNEKSIKFIVSYESLLLNTLHRPFFNEPMHLSQTAPYQLAPAGIKWHGQPLSHTQLRVSACIISPRNFADAVTYVTLSLQIISGGLFYHKIIVNIKKALPSQVLCRFSMYSSNNQTSK